MNEIALVEWIRRQAVTPHLRDLVLGIGDDCAVLRPRAGEDLVFKTDPLIEDVHFTRALKPEAVGARALGRALSDLAAMGAEPRFCLLSVALGEHGDDRWLKAFFRGFLRAARKTGMTLAGGDLARSPGGTHVNVMAAGAVPRGKALRRDGARAGDFLYVSGPLGKPWDRPIQPRLELGVSLRGVATACMDLSDGIALDLARLCAASGTGAAVDHVPVFRGATLERALHGGEDYELLFTLPPSARPPRGSIRIGVITPARSGIAFQGRPLPPRGYDHFATSESPSRKT